MNDWLSLLYVGPQQLLPVIVGVVLWIALAGLGYLVTPRGRIYEANAFYGWAVVSTVFTLVGVVVAQPFFALSVLAALGAVAGLALAALRREPIFAPGAWRVLVLALPLLLIAGAMEPSQWDEFSHWLPAPKYLMLFDGFPTAARPDAGLAGHVAGAAATLGSLRYGRQAEEAADREGMRMLQRARVDPRGMVTFFGRLQERVGDVPRVAAYLSTHPRTEARIARLEGLAAAATYAAEPLMDAEAWEDLRRACAASGRVEPRSRL